MFRGNWRHMLHAPEGDGAGGGGGGGDAGAGDKGKGGDAGKGDKGGEGDKGGMSEAERAELAELRAFKTKHSQRDEDFNDKVDRHRKENERKGADSKAIESAIGFNLGKDEFLKSNAALLPKNVADIFTVAEKERYDSAVEKAADIKSGLIHSFFSVQENLDFLTPSQRETVDEYLKLTKNGRQENAQRIYQSVFEPTLEALKRVRKAHEVNRAKNGFGDGSDDAHKQKLIQGSSKHYLGVKKDGT